MQVFDVNETLLDLAAMDPHFRRIFGDAGVRVTWFNQMIQSALVATVTGVYHQFGAHAMAALEMTAEQAGVGLADDDRQAVAAQMRQPRGTRSELGVDDRIEPESSRRTTCRMAAATIKPDSSSARQ